MNDLAFTIAGVGVLVFLAHLFQGIFKEFKLPDVLLLILVGVLLGPVWDLVQPADVGSVGAVFTTITLLILLFQEGVEMHLPTAQRSVHDSSWLALANFFGIVIAVGLALMYLTDLSPLSSLILGAILGSTSPAVVGPLIRHLNLSEQSRTTLFLEAALSDVLTIVVVLAMVKIHTLSDSHPGVILYKVLASFTVASLVGVLGGLLWVALFNTIRSLKNAMFMTPAFVFVIFGFVEFLDFSGYIAALVFGITLGNITTPYFSRVMRYLPQENLALTKAEKDFFSEVAFLLKTFFFIYVGLTVQLNDPAIMTLALPLTLILLLVRILVVRFTVSRAAPVGDVSLMAAMIPKGLAAIVLASLPLQHGVHGGELIQTITHTMVLVSIVATSLLVFLLEKTFLARGYGRLFAGFGRPQADGTER